MTSTGGTNYFGESRGHLHFIMTDYRHGKCLNLDVYEMLKDYFGWLVKYQVNLNQLPGAFPGIICKRGYGFYVFDVVRGERDDDTFLVLVIPGKIVTYNLHDKIFRVICNLAIDQFEGHSTVHRVGQSFPGNLVIICFHDNLSPTKPSHKYTSSSFNALKIIPKIMVNTRAKIKKTQNTRKICFSQASVEDSDHQSSQSGALIGSNDDLLTEILFRLPVTSILRFKSVSKHWRWLLSQARFTLMHDKLSKSPGLFVRNMYIPFDAENRSTPPFRSLDFCLDLCGIRILQSCNGLLLCCSDRGNERARKYYVFNPTTKQFAIIPSVPGGQNARRTIRFMGLAFHQTDCVHYKVVCVRRVEPAGELFQIQIYSSDIGKWKISNESFSENFYTSFKYGVYWNGAIHWAPACRIPLYFKLMDEQLQKLPLPANSRDYYNGAIPMYFGESRGHLHLVDTAQHDNRLHLNVYEMMMDHSGWFVKYEVRLDELPGAFPEMINSYQDPSSPYYYEFEVFDVVRGEKEEDTFMVIRIPHEKMIGWYNGKIIRYNVHEKSFKEISNLTTYYREAYTNVHRYTETLASF
ncbi:hypothetical protein E3N88_19491 [Mikania micrantha]|uniref:Uncharacterized protein n=1 Tax=Mikania micrantha TaxID=192012 RepID=A0A5N6NQR3_9ASTR|nr:hypothetical protein E3N88_19491 [Mikania micrantha]